MISSATAAKVVAALRTVAAETQSYADALPAASYTGFFEHGEAAAYRAAACLLEAAEAIDEREFKAGLAEDSH